MTNKKKTRIETTMTDTAKRKIGQRGNKELNKKNLEKTAKEAKEPLPARELKYIYPNEKMTQQEKKDFRRKARGTERSMQKQLALASKKSSELTEKEKKEIARNYAQFRKETYSHLN